MKYFSLDDWLADQAVSGDSSHTLKAVNDYKAYLDSVTDRLPPDFVLLTKTICIHDANLRELDVDLLQRRVMAKLDAGDITMRERRVVRLHYEDVLRVSSTSDPTKGLPGPHGYGDLGNDEIEVLEGGRYEHRLLFSSGIEVAITFQRFRLEIL